MGKIMHCGSEYGGGSGGGGASAISDLTDVSLTNLSDGQILKYDATNQVWVNDDESGGGGGTEVIANPSGTPTDELNTVQIGNTIYEIVGGGGSSGGMTALDTTERTDMNTSFELSDAITNYDAILINIYYTGGDGYPETGSGVYSVAELSDHSYRVWVDGGNNDRALQIQFIDSTHYQIISSNGGNGVHGVYGLKFGSGGGSSQVNSEIVEQKNIAIADGTVITLNLTKKYSNPYVYATNILPKTGWGGLVVVNMDFGITYDSANDTLSFKTYTNRAQNYDIYWLITEMSN